MTNILLIEDDAEIAQYICENLQPTKYSITVQTEGSEGLKSALSRNWDLVVLDRMLPHDVDGLDIIKAIRAMGHMFPVIVVSALGQTEERVRCLKAGADDYLPKPFLMEELEARIDAIIRRSAPNQQSQGHTLTLGDLKIDLIKHTVKRGEEKIAINTREFKLLAYLIKNAGQTVTRSMVLENVWEYDFQPETNIIDVHISHLRQKIDGKNIPSIIRTVRGVGYSIEIPTTS